MDISAANWNEDDNANITAAPDGAPEGMAPSGVNNVLRAVMGAVKRWYGWSSPRTTAGTATAYTLNYGIAPGALVDGMTHLVLFHAANGAAATLNVNALGATPLHYYAAGAWRVLPPNLVDANELCRVAYHSSSGAYRILRRFNTGEVTSFAGGSVPVGSLLCAGQQISRTAYAGLFAAIGTTYGAGDSSTTFNLPDLRGRVVAGKDDMGGTNAGRLGAVVASTTLGGSGGGQLNTAATNVNGTATGGITVTSISMDGPNSVWNVADGPTLVALGSHTHANVISVGTANLAATASGTSAAFSVAQPTTILNFLIRI
jgi:microcystin-dependent protein